MIKIYGAVAFLVLMLVTTAYLKGRQHKGVEMRLEIAQAEEASREAFAKLEGVRIAAETQRMLSLQQQEDEARAEPTTASQCLPVSRVRRLNNL